MQKKKTLWIGLLDLASAKTRRAFYRIWVQATKPKPAAEEHFLFLGITGREQDAFDAIICGADAIRDFEGDFSSHERFADQGGLTLALFLVSMGTSEEIQAFYDKGGRFTDQCDSNGLNAGEILEQRLTEAKERNSSAEDISYLEQTLATYHDLVAQQGGLICIDKQPVSPKRWDVRNIWLFVKSCAKKL